MKEKDLDYVKCFGEVKKPMEVQFFGKTLGKTTMIEFFCFLVLGFRSSLLL